MSEEETLEKSAEEDKHKSKVGKLKKLKKYTPIPGFIFVLIPFFIHLRDILFFSVFLLQSDSILVSFGSILITMGFPGGLKGKIALFVAAFSLIIFNYIFTIPDITLGNLILLRTSEILNSVGAFLVGGVGITIIVGEKAS